MMVIETKLKKGLISAEEYIKLKAEMYAGFYLHKDDPRMYEAVENALLPDSYKKLGLLAAPKGQLDTVVLLVALMDYYSISYSDSYLEGYVEGFMDMVKSGDRNEWYWSIHRGNGLIPNELVVFNIVVLDQTLEEYTKECECYESLCLLGVEHIPYSAEFIPRNPEWHRAALQSAAYIIANRRRLNNLEIKGYCDIGNIWSDTVSLVGTKAEQDVLEELKVNPIGKKFKGEKAKG